MTLRGDITELPALRNDIAHLLDGIRDKRIEDDLWFDLSGNGHLTLASRPLSCLERFWEAVVRFFTNKFADLEREFVWVTDRVEEYLAAEKDPLQLGRFLNTYTPALNELYRTAARLGQVQRFSRLSLNSMKRREKIHDLVLTERLASSRDRRYQFHGYFFVGNNIENATVRFQVTDPESGMVGLANAELSPFESYYLDVKSRANLNTIFATVKRAHQVPNQACSISLDGSGQIIEEASVIEDKGVKFWNKGDRPLRICVEGLQQHEAEFLLSENEHHLCPFPAEGDQIRFTASFTTATVSFQIASKMARYSALVDRQGKLSLEVLPLQIGLSGATETYPAMGPDSWFTSNPNNSYELCLLTFRGNTNAQERIFVPRGVQAIVDRSKFVEWFGSQWKRNSVLNATWSQVVCPLPLMYEAQGAQFTSSPLRVRTP